MNINEARKWSQLCKLNWLMEGDENTTYFHKICMAHRRFNFISEIQDGQNVIQYSDSGIEKAFIDYFNEVYQNAPQCKWLIGNLNWRPITGAQAISLMQPFTEAEVLSSINLLGSNKTLGPNGFTIKFFKEFWNIFRKDIMNLFHNFFLNKIVNKALNATYVALIPKKAHCSKVSDFRPISLTTSIYKILAKVLSVRLKVVLTSTIAANQSAFVRGRKILDPILIANEVVDYWKTNKQKGIIIKLDVEKAFDKLNWDFLYPFFDKRLSIVSGSSGLELV